MDQRGLRDEDEFAGIEAEFNAILDESLSPRGPELLYDLVADLGLPPGSMALDVGCGEGLYSLELHQRFGLKVIGIDPLQRHLEAVIRTATSTISDGATVGFVLGLAEQIPVGANIAHLVWCRDVLVLVDDMEAAYREFQRVLAPGGHAIVHQTFTTATFQDAEADLVLKPMGCLQANMQADYVETAIRAAGLVIDRCLVLDSEWGEYAQEGTGRAGTKLLRAARLLRHPERYIQQFGKANYDIAVGDCLWHVYRMIGKLSDRVYVLSKPA